MKNRGYIFILLCWVGFAKGQAVYPDYKFCFSDTITFAENHRYGTPFSVDFNNDSFKDILIRDLDNNLIKIYFNTNGVIANTPSIIYPVPNNAINIVTGDFDGDTYTDVAYLTSSNGDVTIVKNNSGLSLNTFSTMPPPLNYISNFNTAKHLYAYNLDGAGADELIVVGDGSGMYNYFTHYYFFGTYQTSILKNVFGLPSGNMPIASFGYFDNDGQADMVIANNGFATNKLCFELTNWGGSLHLLSTNASSVITTSNINKMEAIVVDDYNGIDKDDIYLLNAGTGGLNEGLKLFTNDGYANFTPPSFNLVSTNINPENDFQLKDFNNDGLKDFISINKDQTELNFTTRISTNSFSGTSYPITPISNLLNGSNWVVDDFDNNGYLDIIISGGFGAADSKPLHLIKNYSYTVSASASNNGIVCNSNPVNLSTSTTNTLSGNYNWLNSSSLIIATNTTSTNVNASGTYFSQFTFTVPYSGNNTCILQSNAIAITATTGTLPTFTLSANSNTLCSSETLTLTANVTNATNYSWTYNQFGYVNMSTNNPLTVSFLQSATVYSFTAENGACYATGTISPTVYQNPFISSDGGCCFSICAGTNTVLTADVTTYTVTNYTWIDNSSIIYPSAQTISVQPSASTDYTVTAYNHNCPSNQFVFTITVDDLPTINATITSTICQGSTATVLYNNTSNVYTTTNSTGTISTLQYFGISPVATTIYSVITEYNGCKKDSTFTINVDLPTVVQWSNSSPLCSGKAIKLFPTNTNVATSYTWSATGAIMDTLIVNLPSGTYNYTLTGQNGVCSPVSYPANISVSPSPTIALTAISSNSVCSGQAVNITLSGAGTYSLIPSNFVGSTALTFTPTLASQTYTIHGSDANGCTNSAINQLTVNIIVTPTPTLSISNVTICSGQQATLTASGATTYQWNDSGGGNVSNLPTAIVSPSTQSIFAVTGNNGLCSAVKNATVFVNPVPDVSIITNSTIICPIKDTAIISVLVSATTPTNQLSYNWDSNPNIGNTIYVSPFNSQTYSVTVTNTLTGCAKVLTQAIVSLPMPTINVTPSATIVCANKPFELVASGAVDYKWFPNLFFGSNYIDSIQSTETYTVYGKAANGCINKTFVTVTLNTDCSPKQSSAFSPNGDGINEFFIIEGIVDNDRVYIYDRWGLLLYQSNSYKTNPWNGRYAGKPVTSGTYFYVVEFNDGSKALKNWLEITGI